MRKYILIFLISLFALLLSNCATSQSEEFNLKKTLIQLATINEAYLLQSEEDDEFWAITDKMTQALEDNPDWFAKFRKENKYYPYTYDERLGITEEEYNNLFISGKYISIVDAEVAYPFSCKLIDKDTYSLNLR
ncbi:hypothetical protein [Alkalibacter saccharofermentans]|uniref:DUF3298 domain-containing protein n=1 Tax=Alkalibacter saccharofermentans DSM 14828 TaxID=1120975 RepID=A0A1M4TCK3_9FIRM|nr:hypothetical protein [Alkalibacter saccharofermentans]SHE42269.1 hypothetical protein SAMN02746064_00454 [Alkalibacter saccharofermentans DSM 14828]